MPEWASRGSSDYHFGNLCLTASPEKDLTTGFFIAVFERVDYSKIDAGNGDAAEIDYVFECERKEVKRERIDETLGYSKKKKKHKIDSLLDASEFPAKKIKIKVEQIENDETDDVVEKNKTDRKSEKKKKKHKIDSLLDAADIGSECPAKKIKIKVERIENDGTDDVVEKNKTDRKSEKKKKSKSAEDSLNAQHHDDDVGSEYLAEKVKIKVEPIGI